MEIKPSGAGVNLDDEIIALAYSSVVDPQMFDEFLETVREQIQNDLGEFQDSDLLDDAHAVHARFTRLQRHVERARALAESKQDRFDPNIVPSRAIHTDTRPAALLDGDGIVVLSSESARLELGLTVGTSIHSLKTERAATAVLLDGLSRLHSADLGDLLCRVAYTPSEEDGRSYQLALTKVRADDGRAMARLWVIGTVWDAVVGESFRLAMSLTEAEACVVEAVVSGKSLQSLADERGRSIGTIRNQLKSAFAKTGVSSQAQLTSLYAGYVQVFGSKGSKSVSLGRQDLPLPRRIVRRPDGTRIQVDLAGPVDGRPVLHFNSLVCGHTVTPAMHEMLIAKGIRLIMPWRAGWGGTTYPKAANSDLDIAADDLQIILDAFGLEQVSVLAEHLGGVYALHAASKMMQSGAAPLIRNVVWVSPTPSIERMQDVRHLNRGIKAYIYLARYAKPFLDAFISFALTKMDSGFDEEHTKGLYKDSAHDTDILSDMAVIDVLRRNFAFTRQQPNWPIAHELQLEASTRNYMRDLPDLPIHLVCGEQHFATGDQWPELMAQRYGNVSHTVLRDRGSLFFLTEPEKLYAILRDQMSP